MQTVFESFSIEDIEELGLDEKLERLTEHCQRRMGLSDVGLCEH